MSLDRKTSVGVGLATIGLVAVTYGQFCPNAADLRAGTPNDRMASGSEKAARWTAGALVTLVSLITKDPTVFVMGGSAVVAYSWQHRYANMVNPMTASALIPSSRQTVHAGDGLPAGYAPVG